MLKFHNKMLEDSTIRRKSSTLNCDEVKLGYDKSRVHASNFRFFNKKTQICNLQYKLST